MSTVIKPKRGSGAPGLGDLVANEIAIDETAGVLYVRDTGNTIIPVGKNLVSETAPALSADLNVDGNALTGTTIINTDNSLEKLRVTNSGVKQLADYSHPFIQYGEPGVEGGELHTWVYGGQQFGLVCGISNTTANGYQMFEFRARHDTTAQPDDGLHMGDLTIFGEDNTIASQIAEDFSNDLKPLSIESDGLKIKSDAGNPSDVKLEVGNDFVNINDSLEIKSGSQNRTIFLSGNDDGEIQVFAFDNTGSDIFTGMHFRTGAGKKIFRLEAKAPGGVDPGDNSYESNFVMSGANNSLLSKTHSESFAPFTFQAEEISFGTENTPGALKVFEEVVTFDVPIGQVNLGADPANPQNGWTYYNDTTHKLRLYANGAWVNLN